jgi:hypothetical protein
VATIPEVFDAGRLPITAPDNVNPEAMGYRVAAHAPVVSQVTC